jgi:hypothetical protein
VFVIDSSFHLGPARRRWCAVATTVIRHPPASSGRADVRAAGRRAGRRGAARPLAQAAPTGRRRPAAAGAPARRAIASQDRHLWTSVVGDGSYVIRAAAPSTPAAGERR